MYQDNDDNVDDGDGSSELWLHKVSRGPNDRPLMEMEGSGRIDNDGFNFSALNCSNGAPNANL